jgi:hypothetical protein
MPKLEHIVAHPRERRYATPLLLHGVELAVISGAAHDLMLDPAWPQAADAIERAVAQWTA